MTYPRPSKHLQGAVYENPYQAPYALNDYTQNEPVPDVKGGGDAYRNPESAIDQHFFDPVTPNDPVFSDMQAPADISSADPIGQIMSDFKHAQSQLKNNGGK